jgi:hypothetical protein
MSDYRGYYEKITDQGSVKMYSKQRPKLIYRFLMRLEKWSWIDLK